MPKHVTTTTDIPKSWRTARASAYPLRSRLKTARLPTVLASEVDANTQAEMSSCRHMENKLPPWKDSSRNARMKVLLLSLAPPPHPLN